MKLRTMLYLSLAVVAVSAVLLVPDASPLAAFDMNSVYALFSDAAPGMMLCPVLPAIKLKEMRDKRGKLVADARALLDKADAEKRALTPEEDKVYKDIFTEQETVRSSIEREERQIEIERQAADDAARESRNKGKGGAEDEEKRQALPPELRDNARATPEYRAMFNRGLVGGMNALTDAEKRALQADADTAGGSMVAPVQFVMDLIKFVDDAVFIRAKATKFNVGNAASLGAPSLDADPADADWTPELGTGSEDGAMSFGKRELHPHPLAKRLKVSNKLITKVPSADELVRARLAYKFGITQEKGFMTGNGANQPLGIFTASALGIPTTRDVSTGNGATAPTFDGLISAKFALKGNYWTKAEWIFHRDVLAVVAKLKDGEGQYLWRESVRAGEPDRLLNLPVNMSEYSPNTLTTGLYVGALGDFSNYWIADAIDMQIQVLKELYAETNQIGFIGRLETDGMPVLAEAFVRVKLG